jgi:GT2 family glycosyltransferase
MSNYISLNPLVSIIIVNWNGRSLLNECLSALDVQTYRNFEIIFVDNGSWDDSLSFIREKFSSIITVELEYNRGFTGGNIAGYQVAKGDFIVLLNNDACLCARWLEYMVIALSSDSRIGFCSSKILIAGTNLIDSAGDWFTTAFTGTKIGEYEDESHYTVSRFVPGACAAAVIYRRSMLDQIGFLDDDFFLNHEDTDLNFRAWLAGWRCLYVPEALVHHKVSASIGCLSDTSVYYFSRNNEWVWFKNIPLGLMVSHLPQRLLYEICSCAFFCLKAGKWRPYLKGKWDALRGIPRMLRKRGEVQRLVCLNTKEIHKELMPITAYLRHRLDLAANASGKRPEEMYERELSGIWRAGHRRG